MKLESTRGTPEIETSLPKVAEKSMPMAEQKTETFDAPEFQKKTSFEHPSKSNDQSELDFEECGQGEKKPEKTVIAKKNDKEIDFDGCKKKNEHEKTEPEQKNQEIQTFERCKRGQDSSTAGDNDEAASDSNTDTDTDNDNAFNDSRLRIKQSEQAILEKGDQDYDTGKRQQQNDFKNMHTDSSVLKNPEQKEKVEQENKVADVKKEDKAVDEQEVVDEKKQQQLKLKEDVDKKSYRDQKSEPEARTFSTNDGETISYEEAKSRICDSAVGHYKKMCEEENRPVDQDQQALRDRISQNIDKMESKSVERLIGNHGTKHLYGDITRDDQTTVNGEPMSGRAELSMLVMGVHHDDGYMDERIHQAGQSDKDHAKFSREIFEQTVQEDGKTHAQFYENYFGKNGKQTIKDIGEGIEAHNIDNADTKKLVDVNQALQKDGKIDELKLAQITMAINDKVGSDQREKLSEFFERNPKATEYAEKLYLLNDMNAANGRGYSEAQKQHIIKEMKQSTKETVFSKNPIENKRLQKSLGRAFDREKMTGTSDFGLDNPKSMSRNFNAGMNCIEVPNNAVTITRNEQGKLRSQIKINLLGSPEENARLFGEKTANRQFGKIVEDMGYKFDPDSSDYCGYDSPKAFIDAGLSKEGATLKESNMTFCFSRKSFAELPQDDSRVVIREAYRNAREKFENSDTRHFLGTMDQIKEIAYSESATKSKITRAVSKGLPHFAGEDSKLKSEISAFYKELLVNIDHKNFIDEVKKALQSNRFASLQKKIIDDYIRRK